MAVYIARIGGRVERHGADDEVGNLLRTANGNEERGVPLHDMVSPLSSPAVGVQGRTEAVRQ
jgi:hypothetical protein